MPELPDATITVRAWHNLRDRFDVNGDTYVSARDALQVIAFLNSVGSGWLDGQELPPPFVDVNGDNYASPRDAIELIAYLNSGQAEAEGEASLTDSSRSDSSSVLPAVLLANSTSANTGLSDKDSIVTDAIAPFETCQALQSLVPTGVDTAVGPRNWSGTVPADDTEDLLEHARDLEFDDLIHELANDLARL